MKAITSKTLPFAVLAAAAAGTSNCVNEQPKSKPNIIVILADDMGYSDMGHQLQHDEFAPIDNYPTRRGFQHFYGTIYGVVDHFDPFSLVNDETPVTDVPEGYYSTVALVDSALAYINRYAMGIFQPPGDTTQFLSPRQFTDSWSDNPTQEWDAHAMAVHAAMIDRMDKEIGKVIHTLEKSGELDNTLILFLVDNGCSNESPQFFTAGENDRPAELNAKKGSITDEPCHVMDIMATCIDVADAKYPDTYNGNMIIPLEGVSFLPILQNSKHDKRHDVIGFEHFREKALIGNDKWKIVQRPRRDTWELYNLNTDRTELHDLSSQYPEKLKEMVGKYVEWAQRCSVFPSPDEHMK